MKLAITIIGAGNVGYHLALRLKEKGHKICQIYSRRLEVAEELADQISAQGINQWKDLNEEADVYLIAIKDDGIVNAAKAISKYLPNKLVAHTSGATPSIVFERYFTNYGVFYPLQAFFKGRPADFDRIPFCIDGNSELIIEKLEALAQSIAPNVYRINDDQRQILHVAAVFVNNFTNHLLTIAEGICNAEDLNFDILKPLLNETVRKIATTPAARLQVGPASRGDQRTIDRHLTYLEKFPDYQAVYKLMTEKIRK